MRKLKLQVQVSVDGYVADTNGRNDWQVWNWGEEWNWDDELKKDFNDIFESTDCILLGRKTAVGGFISHWVEAAENPNDSRFAYATKINDTHKVVFTQTLAKSEWENIDLAKGDLAEEVNRLKTHEGKDIIVYGGATFVSSLIKAGLIDEFQLFVNPTALGNGMTIFKELGSKLNLTLVKSKSYDCGIVVLSYEPKRT